MDASRLFVDIDTQHDFIDADGRLSVPGAESLVEALGRLTAYAVREGIPILSSADSHGPDDPEFAQFPPHCLSGSDGQRKVPGTLLEAPVVVSPAGDGLPSVQPRQTIVEKTTFSMFSSVSDPPWPSLPAWSAHSCTFTPPVAPA